MSKIIYYYQTLNSLQPILYSNTVTHIHLSSIHFGTSNNEPYIHLNDNPPYDTIFDDVWKELFIADNNNIKIILMVGGAGGAYTELFGNFEVYYGMLKTLINTKSFISGIDLDIEEPVSLDNVKMLIKRIKKDFGPNFLISMAPVQSSLQQDYPGMGGFIYKDLYSSKVGKFIDYFNGQFYMNFSKDSYDIVVENGYPEEKVVMGMLMGQDFTKIQEELKKLHLEYGKSFGGVFIWEYFAAPKNWSLICANILTS